MMRTLKIFLLCAALIAGACKAGERGGTFFETDETAEAGKIVADANQDLKKIKVLYEQNEGKRQELKDAMEKNDSLKAKQIADDVVYLINDGAALCQSAVDKIQRAESMKINSDYAAYLRLKEESLQLEMDAFEQYRLAARVLRDNYDPKNAVMKEKVKEEFKLRNDNYRVAMEKARDKSNQANEIAKAAMTKTGS